MSDEEKDINKKNIKQILQTTKDKLKELWIKLWGKDLPEDISEIFPDNKFDIDEQLELYEKLKKKQKRKRFIVSIIIIFIVIASFNYLKNFILYKVKNSPTIACWNKPICSYLGPEINYKYSVFPKAIQMKNGDIYVYHNTFSVWPEMFDILKYTSPIRNVLISFDGNDSIKQFLYKIKLRKASKDRTESSEILKYKSHKFKKINKKRTEIYDKRFMSNYGRIIDLIEDRNGDIVLIDNRNNLKKFNTKTKTYIDLDINYFAKNNNIYLKKLDNNILFMSNNNQTVYPSNISEYKILPLQKKIIQDETLMLLDLDDYKIKNFPKFAIKPLYHPIRDDIIVLKNGKLIIPLRYYDFEKKDFVWDHIEIYDNNKDEFIADYTFDAIENNMFKIELNNNDILFFNKNSTYRFDNENNRFIKAEDEIHYDFKLYLSLLENEANYLGISIDDKVRGQTKYIELDKGKYLITCGEEAAYDKSMDICRKTIYFDFYNHTVQRGPDFPSVTSGLTKLKLNDGRIMFIGGHRPFNLKEQADLQLHNTFIKHINNVQIFEINKDWR